MTMITPVIKDKVLVAIASSPRYGVYLRYEDLFPGQEISNDELYMILVQFEKMGFLNKIKKGNLCTYTVFQTADIQDFSIHGGFTAQEELLRANLEKLNLELLKLAKDIEPSKLEAINAITSILSK